ncbi:MAG TPA: hypothetical protein VHG09_08910, partial [Longimicrobiales bacterium]|nr:hypothetical protein [Longimicrobiales bacterium]
AVRRHLPALRATAAQPGAEGAQVDAAIGCAWAGDAECARELLANLGTRAELRPWSTVEVRAAYAGIARAEGDLRRALQIMAETRTNCHGCELTFIGRLYEELEQPDSAAAAYERYIGTPSMDRLWNDAMLPVMHEMLGGYYEQRGDANAAAQHYARVIALWQNADPVLQPRVEAARQRLAQLQPDR